MRRSGDANEPTACAVCGGPIVVIGIHLGDRPAEFRSCRSCERTSWTIDDDDAHLDEVVSYIPRSSRRRRLD